MNEEQLSIFEANESKYRIFVGFDGFVDRVVRVVKSRTVDRTEYFQTIEEFSAFLLSKARKSCSLEMVVESKKAGGNMPNFANALAHLGVGMDCVGALGYPKVNTFFEQMHPNCKLFSVSEPGTCDALEFTDGKIMQGVNDDINNLNFDTLQRTLGNEKLINLLDEADGASFLNWSELFQSNKLWKGMIDYIFPKCKQNKSRPMLIDISDCSNRSEADIQIFFDLLIDLQRFFSVYVSLNKNEAEQLAQKMGIQSSSEEELYQKILHAMQIENLVIHLTAEAIWLDKNESIHVSKERIVNPKLLTGGGDNFNAGFMFGLLYKAQGNLSKSDILTIANEVSSLYIVEGASPDLLTLTQHLREQKNH